MMMVWPGEEKAWDILSGLDARDVTANAKALFNPYDSTYALTCFGQDIRVSLKDRTIFGKSRLGMVLVTSLGDYSRLSILRYLVHAIDLPLSGRLVRPADLPGGDIFTKGTHIIPLDRAAAYFSNHSSEFLIVGQSLGGTQGDYGDISLNILSFPRVPVVLILWLGDEEFPSTASLLFDSSCVSHLPPDMIWSTSMMTVEMMLINRSDE
ncbi:MAG TPA: hypothetical protein DCZ97_17830 [Syntrophus sp. (in: bacteria)]|nr:hypothetical protein [Syntrophus sp. (in: bacteria)]